MKKFKGFTLIELIVVIAIIGVLAAILVPAMMGWVRKASINSANTNAKSIFTNAQTIAQEFETAGDDIGAAGSGGTAVIEGAISTGADEAGTFEERVNATISTSNNNAEWAVDVDSYVVEAAVFSNNGATYLGAYPTATPTDSARDYNGSADLANAVQGGSWT